MYVLFLWFFNNQMFSRGRYKIYLLPFVVYIEGEMKAETEMVLLKKITRTLKNKSIGKLHFKSKWNIFLHVSQVLGLVN